jgi:hypothetical protein
LIRDIKAQPRLDNQQDFTTDEKKKENRATAQYLRKPPTDADIAEHSGSSKMKGQHYFSFTQPEEASQFNKELELLLETKTKPTIDMWTKAIKPELTAIAKVCQADLLKRLENAGENSETLKGLSALDGETLVFPVVPVQMPFPELCQNAQDYEKKRLWCAHTLKPR